MSLKLIIIPLAFLVMANVITPNDVNTPNSIISPYIGGLGSDAIISCSPNGCTSYPDASVSPIQQCSSQIAGTSSDFLTSIPILGQFARFMMGIGATLSGKTQLAQSCYQASAVFMSFRYNPLSPDSIQFALITVLFIVIGTVILIGITISQVKLTGDSPLNTGAILTLIIGVSLFMLWAIFSGQALPTFQQIPKPFGSYFYFILTLMYSIGIISSIGFAAD